MKHKAALFSMLTDHAVMDDLKGGQLEVASTAAVQGTLDLLISNRESAVSDGPLTVEEAIILVTGRPALLIRDDVWAEPKLPEIRKRLQPATAHLKASVPRVGRVEIVDHQLEYAGTGWMIDKDVMITNRHVAELFSLKRGGAFAFQADPDGDQLKVRIDFAREHETTRKVQFRVKDVVFVEERSEVLPDMALVRIERGDVALPEPIELHDGLVKFHDHVAVIGYPAEDSRNDAFVMRKLFDDIYGVKRLSPGTVSGVRQDGAVLMHDCTTLGGNSGSVVISLDSGKACGLHFAGSYLQSNYAVTSVALKQRLFDLGPALSQVPSVFKATEERAPVSEGSLQNRAGYDADFLGGDELSVPLPEVSGEMLGLIAPVKGRPDGELRYEHFSIKMHSERRVAFFTAVNIDGEKLFNVKRTKDVWRLDPRLETAAHQTADDLYARNSLDRGHLVRRLDPAWGGDRAEALRAVEDTFFFTNCSPQHARLNQKTWLSLEDYILENAATSKLRVSVFTGPVFTDGDRTYREVQLPEEFWKVAVIVNDFTGRLSATGYLLSQADHLSDLEFVFGEFRTYQLPIREIEAKTGLSFGDLSGFDPLDAVESVGRRLVQDPRDLVL